MKFSSREKVLLVILIILVVGLAYYSLYYTPYQQKLSDVETEIDSTNDSIQLAQLKVNKMNKMISELEEIEKSGEYIEIPAYDNISYIMKTLTDVLSQTDEYNLQFGKLSTDDYHIVRRPVTVSYTTKSYDDSLNVLHTIEDLPLRVMLSDMSIEKKIVKKYIDVAADFDYMSALLFTFYEEDKAQ